VPVVAHIVKTQGIAGAENHLFKLLPALAVGGWGVHLVTICDRSKGKPTPGYEAALQRLRSQGVRVEQLMVRNKYDPAGSLRVARTLKTIRPDLVHTHLAYADLFGSFGARMAGRVTIVSSRHRDYSRSPAEIAHFRRYYRLANPLQDAVIAASHRIAELCRTEERRDPRTIHTVWYGCEDQAVGRQDARAHVRAELGLAPDTPLLGTVGRLIPLKGHTYALRAFATIAQHIPDAVWLVVGTGPEREGLETLARSLGVGAQVRFVGHRDDVPTIMAALDLLVHPTTAEGFGLVLLEAMVQGAPVVATRVGSLPEIVVDGESGLLVPPRDPQALTDAIHPLLLDRARRESLGRQGRARYEECFRLERMVQETLRVYQQVTSAS
jgi:glycosyltransferase involved in cell wall biosynthesis